MISVHIVKNFPDFTLKVDFDGENETIGLLGASGCGKSMTLQCIAGILTPDEGWIVLDGLTLFDSRKKINLPPQKRNVGLLFQNYALFPTMTVRENVLAGLHKIKEKKLRALEAEKLLSQFQLMDVADHYPSAISGGQAQRTALARILGSKPNLLMLDEPFTALDDHLRWQVEGELRRLLADFPGSVLFVSHNRDEVYRLCDKVCTIDQGQTQELVTVKELFANPKTKAAAQISGCKNIFSAKKLDENHLLLPDFGVTLSVKVPIPDTLQYVGLRSHFLKLAEQESADTIPCRIEDCIEDVFSYLLMVRPANASPKAPLICIDLSKEEWASLKEKKNLFLVISQEQILLLS